MESIGGKMGFIPYILETLRGLDLEFLGKYRRCDGKLLSYGALSAKTKILRALAVVASKQREACKVAQMKSALNHGPKKKLWKLWMLSLSHLERLRSLLARMPSNW